MIRLAVALLIVGLAVPGCARKSAAPPTQPENTKPTATDGAFVVNWQTARERAHAESETERNVRIEEHAQSRAEPRAVQAQFPTELLLPLPSAGLSLAGGAP